MSSNKFAARLVVRVRPSRGLALYLVLLHLSAAGVLVFALRGLRECAVLTGLLVLSACWHWWTLLRCCGDFVTRLSVTQDGTWELWSASGKTLRPDSNPCYFIGLGVTVLVWPHTGLPGARVVLFPDSEQPEVLRRLRVVLKASQAK